MTWLFLRSLHCTPCKTIRNILMPRSMSTAVLTAFPLDYGFTMNLLAMIFCKYGDITFFLFSFTLIYTLIKNIYITIKLSIDILNLLTINITLLLFMKVKGTVIRCTTLKLVFMYMYSISSKWLSQWNLILNPAS